MGSNLGQGAGPSARESTAFTGVMKATHGSKIERKNTKLRGLFPQSFQSKLQKSKFGGK